MSLRHGSLPGRPIAVQRSFSQVTSLKISAGPGAPSQVEASAGAARRQESAKMFTPASQNIPAHAELRFTLSSTHSCCVCAAPNARPSSSPCFALSVIASLLAAIYTPTATMSPIPTKEIEPHPHNAIFAFFESAMAIYLLAHFPVPAAGASPIASLLPHVKSNISSNASLFASRAVSAGTSKSVSMKRKIDVC